MLQSLLPSTILMYGKSGFLGLKEAGHGRSTVGLTRARGLTLLMGPPDPYGLIVYSDWLLPDALRPLSPAPQDLAAVVRPLEAASWAEVPLAVQIENPRNQATQAAIRLTSPRPWFGKGFIVTWIA